MFKVSYDESNYWINYNQDSSAYYEMSVVDGFRSEDDDSMYRYDDDDDYNSGEDTETEEHYASIYRERNR